MLIQGTNFSERPVLKHQIHNKKYIFPRHLHQLAELAIMLEGSMTVTVNGAEYRLREGEAALVFPFQWHSYHSAKVVKMAMYNISPQLANTFFENLNGRVGERPVFPLSEVTKAMHNERIVTEKDLSLCSVKSFIYSVLTDFTASVALIENTAVPAVVTKVAVYIHEHFSEPINLEHVARAIGYTPNYLSHLVTKAFGLSFSELISGMRVEMARRMIIETDKTSLEIGYECGFGSERSFHRQFKSVTGKTPLEYRKVFSCKGIKQPGINYY